MPTTTVKTLALELKRSTDNLLEQLRSAGIPKNNESDVLSETDRKILQDHLDKNSGAPSTEGTRKKIILTKRETSEIRQSDSAGRTRTVQVEVRKKRVLIKGDQKPAISDTEKLPEPAPPIQVIDEKELLKREAEANRQAELLKIQESELQAANEARQLKQKQAHEIAEKEALAVNALQAKKSGTSNEVSSDPVLKNSTTKEMKEGSEKGCKSFFSEYFKCFQTNFCNDRK